MNSDERSKVLDRLELPQPLSSLLRPTGSSRNALESRHESDAQARTWVRVTARLDSTRRRNTAPYLGGALTFGILCAVVAFSVGKLPADRFPIVGSSPHPELATPVSATGHDASTDLKLVSGAVFERLTPSTSPTAPNVPLAVTFEDGSTLTALSSDTLVLPLAMNERQVTLRLASGTVDVRVVKGGPRQWTIEAGILSVEVVGTHFVVSRTAEHATVKVTEGIVLARGPTLTDGAQRLVAGDDLQVAFNDSRTTTDPPPTTATSAAPSFDTPSFETLSSKADAARQSGDLPAAQRSLQRLLRAFPHDPRTSVAAFQLALVTQQMGAPPERVVAAFESALAKARGQSLRQDCYWRLVLALEHAGRFESAVERAQQSLREYPQGRYAPELTRRITPFPRP